MKQTGSNPVLTTKIKDMNSTELAKKIYNHVNGLNRNGEHWDEWDDKREIEFIRSLIDNNYKGSRTEISDVINSNLVNGELDVVGAFSQIFNEECAKAVLKGMENKQDLIDFMCWLNENEQLGFTSIGIERVVDRYIKG